MAWKREMNGECHLVSDELSWIGKEEEEEKAVLC